MRTLIRIAVLLGVISAAVFLGPEASIRLQIMNASGQLISDLTLVVRTGGKTGPSQSNDMHFLKIFKKVAHVQ